MIAMALIALAACGRKSSPGDEPAPTAPASVLQNVEEVTTEGYRLKQSGDNGAALIKFRAAEKLIRDGRPLDVYQLASILDDQASIYLAELVPELEGLG